MTIQLKRLTPKVPLDIRAFQIPENREGLKEAFDALLSELPVQVSELPQVEGTTGISLRIHHNAGWSLEVQSGDWLVVSNDGQIEAYVNDHITTHFEITDLQ